MAPSRWRLSRWSGPVRRGSLASSGRRPGRSARPARPLTRERRASRPSPGELEEHMADPSPSPVDFRTEPSRYRHWKLTTDGRVATLAMDVQEDGGLRPGYELKLNSYDLGVDIELHDAIQRLRFEHPEVGA